MAAESETWHDIVLDTSAFLQSETEILRKLSNNLWTIQEVLNEVRDEHSKTHLDFAFLTSNVKVRSPKPESLDFVVAFSKKTGDFPALSKTDLLVLALAHELRGNDSTVLPTEVVNTEEEAVEDGQAQVAAAAAPKPVVDMKRIAQPGKSWASVLQKTATPVEPAAPVTAVPVAPESMWNDEDFDIQTSAADGAAAAGGEEETKLPAAVEWPSLRTPAEPRTKPVPPPVSSLLNKPVTGAAAAAADEQEEEEEADQQQQQQNAEAPPPPNHGNSRILSLNPGVSAREGNEDEEDSNDEEWAKPGSTTSGWGAAVRKQVAPPCPSVGCATADFALQNVLLQLRLGVVSLDGRRIHNVKSWVLKCDGCLAIIPATQQRLFCPKCGHATLARLAYSIDSNGMRRYHYAKNRRIKTRGNRFPIPKGADLLLREDQLLSGKWAQRAATKTSHESQFGRDVNDALGLGLKGVSKIQVAFGTQNPNAAKGRERRGASKKKHG